MARKPATQSKAAPAAPARRRKSPGLVKPKRDTRVRDDFIPSEGYISRDFMERENERLWPRVWQVACRVEEIPRVGDYVTYEVARQSIMVVRTAPDTIQSFHNVCQHRGRRLKDANSRGNASSFFCKFHGWSWKIDGSVERILDPEDWSECKDFSADDLHLKETLVDTWGGWVFINMDLEAAPLREYLGDVIDYLDAFEFDRMRIRWHKTVIFPCNWKVALEAFNEGYHVAGSHPQLLQFQGDDHTFCETHGIHAFFAQGTAGKGVARPLGAPTPRTGKPMPADTRQGLVDFYNNLNETLAAVFTPLSTQATARVLTEVPAGTPPIDTLLQAFAFQKEAAHAAGSGWPEQLSLEKQGAAGTAWHVFPAQILNFAADGLLSYRARPWGDDPNFCLFDIWSLQRYAPGAEPPVVHEFYTDWTQDTIKNFGLILAQDFANMGEVQAGQHSLGFAGGRTNPFQERTVSNFHRMVREWIK